MNDTSSATINDIIHVEGNTLTLKVGDYILSLKLEGPEARPSGRLQLEGGKTLFDLVLESARVLVDNFGQEEFSAAELYHIARNRHPDLDIRRNSWNSHVMSSTPNHPSYRHYTSHRSYFRYHGRGRYSLKPSLI
jgi:hypothetical protein